MATTLEQKKNYLDILAVFHYVNGGLTALVGLAVLAFMSIGLGAATGWGDNWEMEAGCSITAVMAFIFIFVGGYAVLNLLAGRALQTRNHTVLVMITSGINCLNVPLGTLLGIFTLVMVSDPQVRWLFEADPHAPMPPSYAEGYGQSGYPQGYGHGGYPQQPAAQQPPATPQTPQTPEPPAPPSDER